MEMLIDPHSVPSSSTSNIKVALGGIVYMVKETNQTVNSKCQLLTNKWKGTDTIQMPEKETVSLKCTKP